MALEANFRRRLFDKLAVPGQRLSEPERSRIWLHYLMTTDARHAPRFVRATLPEQSRAFLVALNTLAIYLLRWPFFFF